MIERVDRQGVGILFVQGRGGRAKRIGAPGGFARDQGVLEYDVCGLVLRGHGWRGYRFR